MPCLRQGWQCPEGNSGMCSLRKGWQIRIRHLHSVHFCVSKCLWIHLFAFIYLFIFVFSLKISLEAFPAWSQMEEGNADSAHLGWALKVRQSELPALGPGEAEPKEEPRTTVSGQRVICISLLKPSLFAWLPEEGSYPSITRAISQSRLKEVFQPRELELRVWSPPSSPHFSKTNKT